MMSEKRFRVMDNDSKQLYCIESVDGEMFSMQEIVDLLNEQQSTIEQLQDENEQLQQQNKVYESFLDENDLEIDWSYLCIQEECKYTAEEIDSNEILCKDCKYLKTIFEERSKMDVEDYYNRTNKLLVIILIIQLLIFILRVLCCFRVI